MYGRASTLYPRTLEMLEQIELLDELNQIGFAARNSISFDRTGKRITSSGWHSMFEKMHGTFQDFILNVRLKFSEGVFTKAYERLGKQVLVGWTLKGLEINEQAEDGFKVTSVVQKVGSNETRTIKRYDFNHHVFPFLY